MRRGAAAVGILLAGVIPASDALAQSAAPTVDVAPSCVVPGAATRMVIWGAGWPNGAVALSRGSGRVTTAVGTAMARPSPVGSRPGTFTFGATITAAASEKQFQILATGGGISTSSNLVAVSTTCPSTISVAPPCLKAPGSVTVSGAGFTPGVASVMADPAGAAESTPRTAVVDKPGTFSVAIDVPFAGGTVPIVATQFSTATAVPVPPIRALAFVEPCPPDPPPTTSTTRVTPGSTTTTAPGPGSTTSTVPAPHIPPVLVPTPGATARVSISPLTVRPGRCNVLVVSAAPPGLAVVARYADGPPVSGQTGPGGGAVLSVCHPHASGVPLGPVTVLVGIGPMAPAPVFSVLRVPPRPQPPLLQSGSDSRRS